MEPQRREYALKKIGISLGITYMEWKTKLDLCNLDQDWS